MVNIAIYDENEGDLKVLQDYITECMNEKHNPYLIDLYMSGDQLLKKVSKYDVIFLEIAMKELDGIQIGKQIRIFNKNIKIIYVTGLGQYTTEAINNVHAFAYLMKPISMESIKVQMDEVIHYIDGEKRDKKILCFDTIKILDKYKIDSVFTRFNIDDIYYFEYVNRRIKIKSMQGEFYFVNQMKRLILEMEAYPFKSCHQNFLVNLKYIQKIRGYDVYLSNGEMLPMSQKKSMKFREKMNEYIHNII